MNRRDHSSDGPVVRALLKDPYLNDVDKAHLLALYRALVTKPVSVEAKFTVGQLVRQVGEKAR